MAFGLRLWIWCVVGVSHGVAAAENIVHLGGHVKHMSYEIALLSSCVPGSCSISNI